MVKRMERIQGLKPIFFNFILKKTQNSKDNIKKNPFQSLYPFHPFNHCIGILRNEYFHS